MTEPEGDIEALPYSRVLVKRPGFYRTLVRGKDVGFFYDESSLPYMIEEFIASSAIQIALTAKSPGIEHLRKLSPILRDHVIVVDKKREAGRKVAAIMEPLATEFHFVFEEPPGQLTASTAIPPALNELLGELLRMLYDFFLGAEHRLQIDLDLVLMKRTLSTLRASAKSSEARLYLAMLEAVFASYKHVSVSSLALKSAASDEQVEHFKHFAEDIEYQRASRGAGLLGVPEDGDRAIQMIKRGLTAVARAPLFKPLVNLTSFVLFRVTPLSDDTRQLVKELMPIRYFPPILSLKQTYVLAEAQWTAQRSAFKESEESIQVIGEGWREQPGIGQPNEIDFARRRKAQP